MLAFVFGLIVASDPRWARAIGRNAALALALGVLFSAARLFMEYRLPLFSTPAYDMRCVFFSLVSGFNTCFWVVAVLGFAGRLLTFTNGFLRYANRISYPFYIFHLVVMVVAGYYITRMGLEIIAEFIMICVASFVGTLLCCELAKGTRLTCFLFGIK